MDPSYSSLFFFQGHRREDDGGDDPPNRFYSLFSPSCEKLWEPRWSKATSFSQTENRLSLFGFRDRSSKKGNLSLSFSLLSLLHSCVTRAELHIALYKEATVASDVLSGEFQAEAIHSSPLCCFTAIIARTLLDAASGLTIYWRFLMRSLSEQRENASNVDCRRVHAEYLQNEARLREYRVHQKLALTNATCVRG